ncbi:MAG TPA: glycerophosphodiester phosphodiesterase [Gemmataceae bacterium]|nr:glycerophosphodiester phosphodiesterase [Gemmataceae bacterium]
MIRFAPVTEVNSVEIIGHRGASFDAPENTLASFRLAFDQCADGIEFDIRLSKDGQIVVIHDPDTKRVAGIDRAVADQTLDQLRALDVGRWKGAEYPRERIPTLAEALAIIPAGKRAYVEVKCGPESVPELKRVIAAAKLSREQVIVISFSADVVSAVKKRLPVVPAYWVVRLRDDAGTNWTADALVAAARAMNADGLDLSADPMITRELVEVASAAGLPVYVWTVNDAAMARSLIAAGVSGIATDRPGWLRETLGW